MIWKKLDDLLNLAGKIVCILVFLICAYAVYDGFLVYRAAGDESLLAYRPDEDGKMPEEGMLAGAAAWLRIDGTPIDYPVMQGIDNAEYINKDPYGKYSISGSIFLDCRNRPDFTDDYSLVYGHHMEHDYMFGVLDRFLDRDFLKEHQTGTLFTRDRAFSIDFFAAMEAPADEDRIFAPTEAEYPYEYILKYAGARNDGVQYGSRMIGLSTCSLPDTMDRVIVFGFLRERPESSETESDETVRKPDSDKAVHEPESDEQT